MSADYQIPFYSIDRMFQQHSEKIMQCVSKVFSSGKVLMGSEIDEFEKQIAQICQRKYAVSVGSGTDALFFSLLAADIKPGDHVLVTSFSFIASASAILRIGAVPIFVDIDATSYMMNIEDLKKKINSNTKAIIAVHLFGSVLNIPIIEQIAKENNLILIEDAAQSLGASFSNRKAGSMGELSCISFDPTKIIGAFGNGGIVLTNNPDYYKKLKQIRYHGKSEKNNDFELLGYNSRLATSQAAILLFEIGQLESWIEKRNLIADYYCSQLAEIPQIQTPYKTGDIKHIYHKFVISVNDRDKLKEYLGKNGIQTMVHFNKAMFEYSLFNQHHFIAENINITHQVKNTVLSLPIYPELTSEEASYICETIKEYFTLC
jgi:dTDP-4-amino-4,6-dideoxygalactose transaminase